LHLQCPLKAGGWEADGDAVREEGLVENLNIVDPNPDPGAALALICPAEVNVRAIAGYLRKVVGSPRRISEAEKVNIEVEGGGHIFDAKDRNDVFDAGVNWRGHCAGMITRLESRWLVSHLGGGSDFCG